MPAKGTLVVLNFLALDIESGFWDWDCYDQLEIFDGPDTNTDRIGLGICGDTIPNDITSSKNTLLIRFTSDSSVSGQGFQIKVDVGMNQYFEINPQMLIYLLFLLNSRRIKCEILLCFILSV